MNEQYTTEGWMWQMYRCVATFINDPSETNALALRALAYSYQEYYHQAARRTVNGAD